MDAVGHTSTQEPQSTHSSASTLAIPSASKEMASEGHSSTQSPHPVHSSLSTAAGIIRFLHNFINYIDMKMNVKTETANRFEKVCYGYIHCYN
jgi:hypothetical protein